LSFDILSGSGLAADMSIQIKKALRRPIHGKVALVTEPAITAQLVEQMRLILSDKSPITLQSPRLKSLDFGYAEGCLLIPDGTGADASLKSSIENLMDNAAKRLASATQAAQQRADEQPKAHESIEAIARGFGIPIE
jgi:hypothetical protein